MRWRDELRIDATVQSPGGQGWFRGEVGFVWFEKRQRQGTGRGQETGNSKLGKGREGTCHLLLAVLSLASSPLAI